MTRKVVVFGDGVMAGLAHFYLGHDSPHDIVAFTVDRDRMTDDTKLGLPVVPFEDILQRYPPSRFSMFVALGYGRMNRIREAKYLQAKELGYDLISYVSSTATTWPGATIGDNCFIMENVVIQPFAIVGNDVIMWSGCHIGHESVIKDHVFISSHVVVSGLVTIEENCFLGVNATLRDGITVARECVVGANAFINRDTQERGVYAGPTGQLIPTPSDRLPSV